MARHFRIETLTEELMRTRMREVLALEELFYREFGMSYAHEVWTEKHFLYSLPGKWELSKAAFGEDDSLIGYALASHDGREEVHGHRGGVHPEWRSSGVWRVLIDTIETDGKHLGLKGASLTVRADNRQARLTYVFQGYRTLSHAELEEFRKRRSRDSYQIEGNRLISPEGYAYYAMYKELK